MEKNTQKTSESSPRGTWSRSTRLATTPVMRALPLGMEVVADLRAKGLGMLPSSAARQATELIPNDQLTMLAKSVTRNAAPTTHTRGEEPPTMAVTASTMPESRLRASVGTAAPMPTPHRM